jgi:hypothetical protein
VGGDVRSLGRIRRVIALDVVEAGQRYQVGAPPDLDGPYVGRA